MTELIITKPPTAAEDLPTVWVFDKIVHNKNSEKKRVDELLDLHYLYWTEQDGYKIYRDARSKHRGRYLDELTFQDTNEIYTFRLKNDERTQPKANLVIPWIEKNGRPLEQEEIIALEQLLKIKKRETVTREEFDQLQQEVAQLITDFHDLQATNRYVRLDLNLDNKRPLRKPVKPASPRRARSEGIEPGAIVVEEPEEQQPEEPVVEEPVEEQPEEPVNDDEENAPKPKQKVTRPKPKASAESNE